MTASLRNKRILIAGGGSGLGLAVAALACGRGAEVVIASRTAVRRRDALAAALGKEVETVALDVASEAGVESALREVGSFDHLVVTIRPDITPAPFAETDIEQARRAFDQKFWGQYRLVQKARGHMPGGGCIVLTSGIAGERVYRNHSTMVVINSATEALCRALAVELAPLRVNAVSPGFVAPKPREVEDDARRFPSGRIAAPEEVAEAYLHLLENPYVTGSILVVDGGARLV